MKINKRAIHQKIIEGIFFLMILEGSALAYCQSLTDRALNESLSIEQYNHWILATDSELAQQRGGFLLPNGVNINFSLEKIIFLNGVEASSSFFQLPENGSLIQNGDQNLASDLTGSALNGIIQNNLDNQVIKTINEINIEISNLQNIDSNHSKVFTDFIMPNVQ
ncbi:hypothetical protein SAMN05216419_103412 [Nitrosomonas cryotolerans]|uniref:Uncharacterized protein n=1 Tax=Nitrosomonas cryotolerans ATCC 49181 TaxID=1131553 RepID=A0A1N6J2I5_9PROT|nr:hypothetical protein [Nitrosomonas cryotolerans]SFP92820.1 hypothetical protein SAMN05216419_103412 [Nitrosomonas cryotolerans]SIO38588.1 hypothetical protein SAMN02743940_2270 [Nitrosomonas cryotolerans ATCC 49181]